MIRIQHHIHIYDAYNDEGMIVPQHDDEIEQRPLGIAIFGGLIIGHKGENCTSIDKGIWCS
jgi:hypothetical protein